MDDKRYPLQWPTGWPRTKPHERKRATFSKTVTEAVERKNWQTGQMERSTSKRTAQVNVTDAAARLEYQCEALGAVYVTLSTNQELRLDGRPKANRMDPYDPGAAVYFTLNGKEICLACDKWDRVADNVAALAAHIDAQRRIERYGIGSVDQAFAGYAALPAKGTTWRTTLGFAHDAIVNTEQINAAFRERARTAHPDAQGGSHDAMASLTEAKLEGLKELSRAERGRT